MERKNPTVEDFERLGAKMRMLKSLIADLHCDILNTVGKQKRLRLDSAMDRIQKVCSRLDDEMFYRFPELSDEYMKVFYGGIGYKTWHETDRRVNDTAQVIAKKTFGDNWHE